ncbi:antibiotic biosynthesis monooxygenase family protein [Amycolatopsis panacis]|uniref:Antibiotic biosynthesis monooxygenase n=1 Tax=Amycolatopsis panacis TaxID=2340917 RepID=A0A419HX86_9PSEU|nr:antibiotic biosynthesis monooxygenase [Amycolatopsis panacis]RJQ81683.1 antibiotic biosynthesis monooxygenase [Amycolatopsis panacis]
MPSISTERDLFTLINVFTVDTADQCRLFDLLTEATETIIRHLPGFVSASFHLSEDGRQVINYAQWRSRNDFEVMHDHPDFQPHIAECRRIATVQPVVCRVRYTAEGTHPGAGQ